MKKSDFPKSLKVYELLPESEATRWYTDKQVVTALPQYFSNYDELSVLDLDDKCEKRHFLEYTDAFMVYLKGDIKAGFHDYRYRVSIRYDYNYIKANVDKKYFESEKEIWDEIHFREAHRETSLRQHLSDRRSLIERGISNVPVEFYGEKRDGIRQYMKDDSYRLYYGFFMLGPYVDNLFRQIYGLSPQLLRVIMFLYPLQYFAKTDLAGCISGSPIKAMDKHQSMKSILESLVEMEYIQPVKYDRNSKFFGKKRSDSAEGGKVKRTTKIYRCMPLLNRTAREYMDYMLLKRKLPDDAASFSDVVHVIPDLNADYYMRRFNPTYKRFNRRKRMISVFYEVVYEYVNMKSANEFMSDAVLKDCERAGNVFRFNPYMWELTKLIYYKSQGKDTNSKYLKNFFKRFSFGIDID